MDVEGFILSWMALFFLVRLGRSFPFNMYFALNMILVARNVLVSLKWTDSS